MKLTTYFLIFIATSATVILGIKAMSLPIAPAAFGFITWAISPYIYLAIVTALTFTKAAKTAVLVLSFLVSVFGIYALADAMYIYLDAQSGLVFAFAPLWQWAFFVLTAVPLYFLNRTKSP